MSSEDLSKVSEIDQEKPEIEVLLEKIEKSIVQSILQRTDRLETTAQEAGKSAFNDWNSDQVGNTKPTTGSRVAEKNTFYEGDCIWSQYRWEFLNPIILYKDNWMSAKTEGINLEEGTYRIIYRVAARASGETGLALFNKDKRKIERLVSWESGTGNSGGSQYLAINSPVIINITDVHGNFNPRGVDLVYIVTVFRAITTPD